MTPKATADTLHKPTPTTAAPAAPPPVYPLTGTPATNAATAGRPALSVKIDNVAGSFPQAGVDHADIVTEALVEGGLTRLFATFQSQDTGLVGPIRSARPVDAALLRELNGGIFAYSGAATGEIAPVKASSTAVLISDEAGVPAFHRVSYRSTPHNVFSSTTQLYAAGRQAGVHWAPPPQLFDYSTSPQGGPSVQAGNVSMSFSAYSSAGWTWSPAAKKYVRTQNGSADMNIDGSRMAANNVVIISSAVGPTGIYDAAGNQDPNDIIVGSGPAWVLRDGRMTQGTWERPDIGTKMSLVGPAGPITLEPGTTWLELLPRPFTPHVTP